MDGDADRPSDLLRARAAESRTKLRLYLAADRRLVAGAGRRHLHDRLFRPAGPVSRTFGVVPIAAVTSTVSVLPFGPFILRKTEGVEDVVWDGGESR